jgi:hypothetical protein
MADLRMWDLGIAVGTEGQTGALMVNLAMSDIVSTAC